MSGDQPISSMPVADATESSTEFFARLEPGTKLAGCYLLKKKVPGTVQPLWIVEDEVLGKEIALHFLPSGLLARSEIADRVRQEVKRARQFINPRVLRVHDLVEEEDWAAVAMDSFAGQPLSAVVAENTHGFFEAAEVWPLARELCETLDEAHRLGFVHGGVSPENVLVGEGKAKVMNFGISACLRAAGNEAAAPFASAQQLSGAASTPADDVFGTGALLHALLAGAAPFEGEDRTNAPSVSEHRRKLNHRGGEVPENWESTIASCLAQDPAKRPASCGAIAKQLESTVAAMPAPAVMSATPTPVVEPAPTPVSVPAPAMEVVPPAVEPTSSAPVEAAPAMVVESTPVPATAPETPAAVAPDAAPAAKIDEPVAKAEEPAKAEAFATPPPVEETKPVAKEEASAPKEEARPEDKPNVEPKAEAKAEKSSTTQTSPTGQTSSARVNEDALADQVRREEARRFRQDDDEEFYDRSHGSGPSVLTWFIVVGILGLFGYLVYPYLFPKTPSSSSSAVTNVDLVTPEPVKPSTPEPTPIAKKEPSTPVAMPSTPAPAPEATPKPMAQDETAKPATPAPSAIAPAIEPKQIEVAIAELKQTREKTAKELPATKKAADDLGKQEQKFAEDLKKAEAAAAEAEKAAAERKKALEDLRKTATAATEQLNAKKAEVAKSEEQIVKLDLDLKEKERALIDAKATAEAAKRREVEAMRLPTTPQPTVTLMATPTPAPVAMATPSPRAPSTPVSDDPRQAFEAKMKELSKALSATPAPAAKAATPAPGATPAPSSTLPTPAPAPGAATAPAPSTAPAMELAKATTPEPVKAGKIEGNALVNSLGMKLIPLTGSEVMMCIWPTRVRDFEVFARKMGLKSVLWRDPGFKQSGDHPVVNVTWEEATAFCKWLTTKERAEGVISATQSYRLPTDIEWSQGVGLGKESGATPEMRDMGVADVYPWGKAWPPPTGSGNYTGEETGSDVAIKGYNDGFPWTSPVGSFPANKQGFYDMGGNVWQWCMDSWSADSKAKVLRGASWYNGALKLSLLSSCRVHASPDSCTDNYGFRVVLAGSAK